MQNEARMTGFEAMYSKLIEVSVDSVNAARFITADSYTLPRIAAAYRVYCATLDSLPQESWAPVHRQLIMNTAQFKGSAGGNPYADQ